MVSVVPAPLPWIEALAEGDEVFRHRFGIEVVDGWVGFPEALPHVLDERRKDPDTEWGTHLFLDDDGALVGFGGWKGPPADGAAELGYAVAPARQGRGIATAVVDELVRRARSAGLSTVVAHTLPAESASTAVLRKNGFVRAGDGVDTGAGEVWRWELPIVP
jgi:[ribosomal protein S5]-alanine N-acetyltransferase